VVCTIDIVALEELDGQKWDITNGTHIIGCYAQQRNVVGIGLTPLGLKRKESQGHSLELLSGADA
jgi:hypothetical protein